MNVWVPVPAMTAAVPGVTVTLIGAAIVTEAEAVFVESAPDTAMIETVAGLGTAAGAM